MIEPPAAPPGRRNKRTIALVVMGVVVAVSLCAAGAVALTIRSGVLDPALDTYEDQQRYAALREGACLAELPRAEPDDPLRRNVRPPEVVDCHAEEAEWIIDDASPGVSRELFYRYLEDDRTVEDSDICDTSPQRLEYAYGVPDRSGDTVTVYCIASIPIGPSYERRPD